MILIDANLLIYATNRDAPRHAAARAWLEEVLSGDTEVGLAWVVLLAFVRITTHPSIMERPLATEVALSYVDDWLAQPLVRPIAPSEAHWPILRTLLHATGSGGNLTSDAHLAAMALEHGAEIYSADYDFQRFPGVTHVNPLAR